MKKTSKHKIPLLKNFKDKRIEIAPHDEIDSCPEECAKLLKALGHPEALVTDESALTDFWTFIKAPELKKKIIILQKKLGVKVNYKDYLIDVIRRMKNEKTK